MALGKVSNIGRKVNYLNKDFSQFRENLINFSKTYFPQTYTDFNESSPGMMFIEMASYIGDVLGYYIDDTLKESLLTTAEDRENLMDIANIMGYKTKPIAPAITQLSVYQTVPSKFNSSAGDYEPDTEYFLRVKQGLQVRSTSSGILFTSTELLDFNDENEREISIYERDSQGKPSLYLVKKKVNAISAEVKSITVNFGSTPEEFANINISDRNVIDVYDVRDSDGNKWYEVPYLGQEMVYVDYPTSEQNDKDLAQFKNSVSNVLRLIKSSRRFVTKTNSDNTTSLVFGGGTATNDETLIPNFKNVGLGLNSSIDKLGSSFDPSNFLKTKSYGQAPTGEFTISYYAGGGVDSNVPANDLVQIDKIEFDEDENFFSGREARLFNATKNSVAVDNEAPARGGRGEESIEEIRQNALASFGAQNRAVTRKDYQVRALSLPSKYGKVAKAYCSADGELDNNSPASILSDPKSLKQFTELVNDLKDKDLTQLEIQKEIEKFLVGKKANIDEKNNPFAINLYVLGYDSNKYLNSLNRAVKQNLKTYLNEYRVLTDGVNLLDGFVINIGVDFEIRVYGGYNTREILLQCQQEIQEFFNIDNWSFNQPINISELELAIANVEGVQSVPKCEVVNKCGGTYSNVKYNISNATKNKQVYPSLDPSVFELKYPNKDIKGRVV
jgi:hypothetical protein